MSIDFALADAPLYLNLQWGFGFAIDGGNTPQSFKDEIAREELLLGLPLFNMPEVFVGLRF